jgi:hypothetical protein
VRRLLTLVVAASVVLSISAAAGAKTVSDGNDTRGKIDIKKGTFSKLKHGKFRIVVVFFETVPPKGEQGNEYIQVWKTKPHFPADCNGCYKESPYTMQGPQTGEQPVRTHCGAEGDPCTKTGTGTIKRKGKRLTFTFPRKAVGKPQHKLFWRVGSSYYGDSDECPTLADCQDYAPNPNKVVKESW